MHSATAAVYEANQCNPAPTVLVRLGDLGLQLHSDWTVGSLMLADQAVTDAEALSHLAAEEPLAGHLGVKEECQVNDDEVLVCIIISLAGHVSGCK